MDQKKVDGDVKIEKMIGLQHQEMKRIEMVIGVEIEVVGGLMIVTLKEVHREELVVRTAGEDLKGRKEVLLVVKEMVRFGEEEMIVVHVMIEDLGEEIIVVLVEETTGVLVQEMIGVVEMIVVHLIGGLDQGNLIEMINPQGTVIAVMIDEIEAMLVVGVIIGDPDQEWVTETVEALVIADLPPKTRHLEVKTQQTGMKENGKLSANVNLWMVLQLYILSNMTIIMDSFLVMQKRHVCCSVDLNVRDA